MCIHDLWKSWKLEVLAGVGWYLPLHLSVFGLNPCCHALSVFSVNNDFWGPEWPRFSPHGRKSNLFCLCTRYIFKCPLWAGDFSMYWRCNSEQDKTLPCSFGALQTVKLYSLSCILSLLISYPTTNQSPLLILFFIQTTDTFLLSQLSFSTQLTIWSLNFPSTRLPSSLNRASTGDCSREQRLSDCRNASLLAELVLFKTFIALHNGDLPESLLFWFLYRSLLFLLILFS